MNNSEQANLISPLSNNANRSSFVHIPHVNNTHTSFGDNTKLI
jgi:hypothetical protein